MTGPGCPAVRNALSDETLGRVVHVLLEEECANVTDLSVRTRVLQPTMSKQLRILRDAGIVVSEKEGSTVWCRVTPEFRQNLRNGTQTLDRGCCMFRFDESLKH